MKTFGLHDADVLGAAIGTGSGTLGFFEFWWSRLSFIPGTQQLAQVVAVGAAVAGLLCDQYLKSRRLGIRKRLAVGIISAAISVGLFLTYNAYVIWATKGYYVRGFPLVIEYFLLFAAALLWSLLFAILGRTGWNQIFPPSK
jgi:hypothetical protein